VTACRRWRDDKGVEQKEIRNFGTFTADLRNLGEWVQQHQAEQVAMESTGSYWRPVWNVLEGVGVPLVLANAYQIKNVPGRKTDVKDAEWISDLLQYGLVPRSFVPDQHLRDLRELTRMRSKIVQDHTRVVNRIQAILEDANIKLASVVSDILGVSSRAMLQGLIEGRAPAELAQLAQGKMRKKRWLLERALEGDFRREHAFLVKRSLMQTRFLEQQEKALRRAIETQLNPQEKEMVALWDTIPGVNETVAWTMVAEIGIRPEQFSNADHLASWVGLCPGNNITGGKRRSGKIRKGNPWLRAALGEAAWAASHTKGTYLAALHRRLAARRGEKRALVAVAHAMVVAAYQMLKKHEPYRDLGENYFDQIQPERTVHRLVGRLEKLGYQVSVTKAEVPHA
jgi:transposase